MCGVWIALEDVASDSGELFVYPGSHKTPRLRAAELGLEKVKTDYSSYVHFDRAINELISDGGYQRVPYMPRAGQILVWHENLIHGGSYRRDRTKTRLSIVSHYFAKGSVAYYDSRGEAATLELLPGLT
jgi:ectoine hydroxylase-related dioxygenase (phytanoyl-CoA dioxygenase family)